MSSWNALGESERKKRRKKVKSKSSKFKGTGLKIVDDFDDPRIFSGGTYRDSSNPHLDIPDMEDEPDELPQIAGVIDERPAELQAMERFNLDSKWKKVLEDKVVRRPLVSPPPGGPSQESTPSPPRRPNRSPSPDGRRPPSSPPSPPRLPRKTSHRSSVMAGRDRSGSNSPPRRPAQGSTSLVLHRDSRRRSPSMSPPRRPRASEDPSTSSGQMSKTLDGRRAGLQRASALRDEMIHHREREIQVFETMSEDVSGRNAKTKIRNRETGKERDFEAESKAKQDEQKQLQERKEQYNRWGKGLKQVADQAARVDSALHEMSKPLARYKDDDDLDVHLKNQDRDGDPMLKFLSKSRGKSTKPGYSGPPPLPNRFNIPPGYRWDGVDRSNGYEKDWFGGINSKKALEEEAYKWSVEDL